MKIGTIMFISFAYAIGVLLYASSDASGNSLKLPTLAVPFFSFYDVSTGCGGFTDCIGWLAAIFYNFVVGIIFIVLMLINIIVYMFQFITLLFTVMFSGASGAPGWVNALLVLPLGVAVGFSIYKLIRKGASND